MKRNGLSAGGAKAVTRSYMSGWYERLCDDDVRTLDNPTFICEILFCLWKFSLKII